jgi:hypothetical protein
MIELTIKFLFWPIDFLLCNWLILLEEEQLLELTKITLS